MKYKKYKSEIISKILEEYKLGASKLSLSNKYNVPRGTLKYWINNPTFKIKTNDLDHESKLSRDHISSKSSLYSYILGLYLGDGYINSTKDKPFLYRLRISQDSKYINSVRNIQHSLSEFFNGKSILVKSLGCYQITISKKHLDLYFPQHGIGKKHLRKIELTEFQKSIIDKIELMKGLYESDGCLYLATHFNKDRTKSKSYYRYNFTNKSKDIINIFIDCLNHLNVKYGVRQKQNGIYVVQIQTKSEVSKLEPYLLPKN